MATISDHVSITATLQTATSPVASFNCLFLAADTADVPRDVRYITTTKSAYTDDLTDGSDADEFATLFFGQDRTPDTLVVGHWAESAAANYLVFPDATETIATWAAITDGYFKITEAGESEAEMGPINFSTFVGGGPVTTMAQVASAIESVFAGVYASYTCTIDASDRLIITSDNTGASAAAISVAAGVSGTDITQYMDLTSDFHVAGTDAETPAQALTAISDIYDDYYYICYRGANGTGSGALSEQTALSTAVQSLDKVLILVSSHSACIGTPGAGNIGYDLAALDHKRTMVIYTEHTDEFVDGAMCGLIIPADEGTVSWAWEPTTSVSESALGPDGVTAAPLTSTERTNLEGNSCNWFERISGSTFLYPGLCTDDIEMRVIVGRDWFVFGIQGDIFADMLNSDLNAFDNATLAKFEGIVREWLDTALERRIIVDTEDRPISVDFPDADDFTQAQRASHTMTLSDVFTAYLNSAVNDVVITGTFVI